MPGLFWSTRVCMPFGRAMIKASPNERIKANAAVKAGRLGIAISEFVEDEENSVDYCNPEVFLARILQSSYTSNWVIVIQQGQAKRG